MPSNTALKTLRKVHLYLGLFIAPALLFFAFTGAVQTLSLHEDAGTSYRAPSWLSVLGQIHKKQTSQFQQRKPQASAGNTPAAGPAATTKPATRPDHTQAEAPRRPPVTLNTKIAQHLPLKIFFLLVSVSLFTSTLTGIYMAYRYERGKILVTGLLVLGVVIPLVLLRF